EAGQAKVVKCFNCLGEGHMAKQYCDDISSAKAILMENLSSYDLDVLSDVPYYDTYLNEEMSYSEQTHESHDGGIQDTNSSTQNDLLVLSLVEQMTDHVANLDKEY
ncbi:hypothetical protein Tco_1024320, partial [Tanacetum coccineum]